MNDKIIDIIDKNYNKFQGTNEANLHASEEIVKLIVIEIDKAIKFGIKLGKTDSVIQQFNSTKEYITNLKLE